MSDQKSFQVSFIVHYVKGDHIDDQSVVVNVEDKTFLIEPRVFSKRKVGGSKCETRYYESGFTTYVNDLDEIHFSVGIVTPKQKNRFYLHSFSYLNFQPPNYPQVQDLTMKTPAQMYEISVTVLTTPAINYSNSFERPMKTSNERLSHTYNPSSSPRKSVNSQRLFAQSQLI